MRQLQKLLPLKTALGLAWTWIFGRTCLVAAVMLQRERELNTGTDLSCWLPAFTQMRGVSYFNAGVTIIIILKAISEAEEAEGEAVRKFWLRVMTVLTWALHEANTQERH